MKIELDGRTYDVAVTETGRGGYRVVVDGKAYQVKVPQDRTRDQGPRKAAREDASSARAKIVAGSDGDVRSPLPGVVATISVGEGDTLEAGQTVATLESMKMHVPVTAPRAAVVKKVLVSVGDNMQTGDRMMELG